MANLRDTIATGLGANIDRVGYYPPTQQILEKHFKVTSEPPRVTLEELLARLPSPPEVLPPEERQRRAELEKERDYENKIYHLKRLGKKEALKNLLKERDAWRESKYRALYPPTSPPVSYFPPHQNTDVKRVLVPQSTYVGKVIEYGGGLWRWNGERWEPLF